MNKSGFIKTLAENLPYSENQCMIICDILENHFFINGKNKNKIISEFMEKLSLEQEDATHVYDVAMQIIQEEIHKKLRHPFRSQD